MQAALPGGGSGGRGAGTVPTRLGTETGMRTDGPLGPPIQGRQFPPLTNTYTGNLFIKKGKLNIHNMIEKEKNDGKMF